MRQRTREMFEEYGSTLIYAVLSVGVTFLILYFIGYSDEIQPVISAQLWLVFGIGLAVILLFCAEAFFATRPLYVRIHSAFSSSNNNESSVSATTAAAVVGNVGVETAHDNSPSRRKQRNEEIATTGGGEEIVQGTFMKSSISSTSIDINTHEEEEGPTTKVSSMDSSSSFRSPAVIRRDHTTPSSKELTKEELRNLGLGSEKLSPLSAAMSALEAN